MSDFCFSEAMIDETAAAMSRVYGIAVDRNEVARCMYIAKAAMLDNVGRNREGKITWSINVQVSDLYGKTDEEIEAVIQRKIKLNKKSAGARALVRKYGRESAERIVAENAGRPINLG